MTDSPQIRIDTSSETPAYRQLADQLRTFLVEGVLQPGQSLPALRRMATELGVHFNTVAEAYRMLEQEGFVKITHGHGARVVDRELPAALERESAENFRQKLRELVASVRARGLSTRHVLKELRMASEALEAMK